MEMEEGRDKEGGSKCGVEGSGSVGSISGCGSNGQILEYTSQLDCQVW